MAKLKIKKNDTVRVISGKDKGKEGKILVVDQENARVIVEGVNMVTKHMKQTNAETQAGIVHKEAPIDISNVMLVHDGKVTRVGIKTEVKTVDGKEKVTRTRYAKSNGDVID